MGKGFNFSNTSWGEMNEMYSSSGVTRDMVRARGMDIGTIRIVELWIPREISEKHVIQNIFYCQDRGLSVSWWTLESRKWDLKDRLQEVEGKSLDLSN